MSKYLLIRRTITEEFEVTDVAADLLMEAEGSVPGEDFYIDLFERHNGSVYGEGLFGDMGNTDVGYELIERDDTD